MKLNLVKSDLLRCLLIGVGWISIVAGIVGIFLPLVPSVPFLLLSVFCFSRSSERFHTWLVEHKHLGPMLKDYLVHGAIPMRAKIAAVTMIWISLPVSALLFVEPLWLQFLLLALGALVTLYLCYLPTLNGSPKIPPRDPDL